MMVQDPPAAMAVLLQPCNTAAATQNSANSAAKTDAEQCKHRSRDRSRIQQDRQAKEQKQLETSCGTCCCYDSCSSQQQRESVR